MRNELSYGSPGGTRRHVRGVVTRSIVPCRTLAERKAAARTVAGPGLGRRVLAARLAANPPDLGGHIQTRMDFAQRAWTQPAVLVATRNE